MKDWKLQTPLQGELNVAYKNLPKLTAQLLFNRGITEEAKVQNFLSPKFENLHDPFLFSEMEKAVDRVWQALEENEKIVIYSDYDADAVTASAVLTQTFGYLNHKVEHYIPDRFSEGYGLNLEAFSKLKEQKSNLIITVDCGTNSLDVAEFCNQNGMDLIITDHHEITGEIPKAFALINPKNPNEKYPDPQITGVGVAYKLATALLRKMDRVEKRLGSVVAGWEKWLLDLVAVGTVADCHSLAGENRILVGYGLKVLSKTRWPGLRALLELSGSQNSISSETLGFALAPRINSAGRLAHASLALNTLTSNSFEEAYSLARELEATNERRKQLTSVILSEARSKAELEIDRKILVLAEEGWHKGLVGIVAGKLAEEFSKPAVILEKGEEEATGSVRSFGQFNTVEALKSVEDTLLRFGGHKEAAGLTLATKDFDTFKERLLYFAENSEVPNVESENNALSLEAELFPTDLNLNTLNIINELEPFGTGNPKPVFLIRSMKPLSWKRIGKDKTHLQAKFLAGNRFVETVGFSKGYLADSLEPDTNYDLAVELIQDNWNGNSKLKLRIVDVKKS